jgi:hypothetical protein
MLRVCGQWSEVVRQTRQNLSRLQESKGLDTDVVGVIEIQEKRFDRTGEPVPHLHIVLQGKASIRSHWASSPHEYEDCYRRAIEAVAGEPVDMRAACNTQGVRKSVVNYLGKYVSKGVKSLRKIREDCGSFPLPKAWHTISRNLSQQVSDETEVCPVKSSYTQIEKWLNRYAGKIYWKKFEMEENGATLSIYGTIEPKDVDRFKLYIATCSGTLSNI